MSAHHHLNAARQRAAATLDRRPLLVGLLVLDAAGEAVEVVGPFGTEPAAHAYAAQHRLGAVRLVPLRLAV